MEEISTISNESFLNGIQSNSEIPNYFTQDINKVLTVNDSATGLVWSDEINSTGYISERGDGSTNTPSNYVGYIFKNKLNSGLFNYTSTPFDILALRINNFNVLECTAGQINARQNIFLEDDSFLTSQRINFGAGNCGISGHSYINGSHAMAFRTDNNTRMEVNTQDGILAKTQIKIDSGVSYTRSNPHISKRGTFIMGISFDEVYGHIEVSASGTIPVCFFRWNMIECRQPILFKNPMCYPDLRQIIDGSYTVPANCSGNGVYYMRRGLVTHSDIIFPNPAAGYNPRYEIITDGNGNSSTFTLRMTTVSNDVLLMFNGSRTLLSPVINYTLTLNAHYILQFVEEDNRWLMIRTA